MGKLIKKVIFILQMIGRSIGAFILIVVLLFAMTLMATMDWMFGEESGRL